MVGLVERAAAAAVRCHRCSCLETIVDTCADASSLCSGMEVWEVDDQASSVQGTRALERVS